MPSPPLGELPPKERERRRSGRADQVSLHQVVFRPSTGEDNVGLTPRVVPRDQVARPRRGSSDGVIRRRDRYPGVPIAQGLIAGASVPIVLPWTVVPGAELPLIAMPNPALPE